MPSNSGFSLDQELCCLIRGKHVFSAFSGGADSMALLLLLHHTLQQAPGTFRLSAVHFEHGIRGKESCDDAVFCGDFCARFNIPLRVISLNTLHNIQSGEGVEECARRLRRIAWNELVQNQPDAVIALGHHADDRKENLLLRLCRGANASGLTSMRKIQLLDNVLYIRPLLDHSRTEVEGWLEKQNISDFRIDSTNCDTAYKRNFLRNDLLPHLYQNIPYSCGGLLRAIEALEQDADALEQLADEAFRKIKGKNAVPNSLFHSLHPAVRARFLRLFLSERAGRDVIPDHNFLVRIEKQTAGDVPLSEVPDCCLRIDSQNITFVCKTAQSCILQDQVWNWKCRDSMSLPGGTLSIHIMPRHQFNMEHLSRYCVCFDADILPDILIAGSRKEGDRMIPFGETELKRLKKIFCDAKIISAERDSYPVIRLTDGTPIWLVGLRRSAFAPVSDDTANIAVIEFNPL